MLPQSDLAAAALQRAWRARASWQHSKMLTRMREMTECAVCGDECVRMVRCLRGHGVCVGCAIGHADPRCPLCRAPRPIAEDTSFTAVLRTCAVTLRCSGCGRYTPASEHEAHRAWCPAHRFECPCGECNATVHAAELARHVREAHPNVPDLARGEDLSHHLVAALSHAQESIVCLAGDVVVVLTTGARVPHPPNDRPPVHVYLRAYYPRPGARPLYATISQLRVADCAHSDGWTERHRLGVVPPMLASRESVVVAHATASFVPRTGLAHEPIVPFGTEPPPVLVVADAQPGPRCPRLTQRVMAVGVRDVAEPKAPLEPFEAPRRAVALVHVRLCEGTMGPAVGALYQE